MTTLGVVGAGTMGAGIAQTAVVAGFDVVLYDTLSESLERGEERLKAGLTKSHQKGQLGRTVESAIREQLTFARSIDVLAQCDVVIEAAPERLDLKRRIFAELGVVCRDDTILASNTSSIPITAIAGAAPAPERVIGLHFFNPVPLMRLVEIIPAEQTSASTVQRAREVGEALGKRVVIAPDGPGFLVNRCGRPFYGEALRLLTERVADVDQIDRICRIGGQFRMGPFELMDLVGVDVSLEIWKSFTEMSFGEPRWRPSPLQARVVAAGRHGRKTGRGWYSYDDGPHRPGDPEVPEAHGGDGKAVAIVGRDRIAEQLRRRAVKAGFVVSDAPSRSTIATVFTDALTSAADLVDVPDPIVSCAAHSLAFRHIKGAVGFSLPNFTTESNGAIAELTRSRTTPKELGAVAAALFTTLGTHIEWVNDAPGLVLGRILAQVVNESAFAHGEGLATASDIDAGAMLGLNYPRGPLSWGAVLGWEDVLGTLNGLWEERREERYRAAPALIAAAAGEPILERLDV